jgi:hypothetical protein
VVHLHNQPDCGGGPSRDLGRLAKVAGRIGYAARWRGRGADRSSLICRALNDAGADRVLTGTLAADCRIFSLIVDTPDTGRAPGVLGSEPCSDWLRRHRQCRRGRHPRIHRPADWRTGDADDRLPYGKSGSASAAKRSKPPIDCAGRGNASLLPVSKRTSPSRSRLTPIVR